MELPKKEQITNTALSLFVLLKSTALILVWGYVSKDAQTEHEGQRKIFPKKPDLTQRVPRQRYGRTIYVQISVA